MIEDIEGIVVSERSYGETSKILNIITKEHGVIGVMAKGAKTMKSELRSVSGKLTYGTFHLYYKKDKLSTLTGVDVKDSFKNIKKDITKITYASFLLELAEQVMKQSYRDGIYELLISALMKIEEGFDPMVITDILELKYLDYLGVLPVLDACSICGSDHGITTLAADKGGYVCRNCYTNERVVDEKTIKLIRLFYYVDLAKISKLDVSSKVKREIDDFLDDYYDRYTGLYLKSKSFLKNLNQIS